VAKSFFCTDEGGRLKVNERTLSPVQRGEQGGGTLELEMSFVTNGGAKLVPGRGAI